MIMPRVNYVDFRNDNFNFRYIYFPQKVSAGRPLPKRTFFDCYELEHLRLPTNINNDDNIQFYRSSNGFFNNNFTRLRFVRYPSTPILRGRVFDNLPSLERIDLTPNLQIIQRKAITECPKLKTVNLPEGLKQIDGRAFHDCPNLTDVTLPSTIERMYNDSFDATTTVSISEEKKGVIPSDHQYTVKIISSPSEAF